MVNNVNALGGLSDIKDGWENEEWGSLEEEPNEEAEANDDKTNEVHSNNHNSHATPVKTLNTNNLNSNSHSNANNNLVTPSPTKTSNNSNANWENYGGSGWDNDEFEPIDDTTNGEFFN